MPFDDIPFENRDELINHLIEDMNIDEERADEVADVIVEEAEDEEGNASKLLESIRDGAKSIMSNLGLETVSWVENPSQDSMFVMMKNNDDYVKKTTRIYKDPEQEWKTVYGPVMRPNDIDKDGDIATAHDIRKAAHEFMADGKVEQFDTDHDLNTGKGTMVESWVLKEDKEYELPDGSSETIEEGSWMVGVQPTKEVKERIEQGEITGWSIFGQADKIELKQGFKNKTFNNHEVKNTSKDDTMSENQSTDGQNDQDLSLKDVHSELKEFKEAFTEYKESPDPSTVKSVEELKQHLKSEDKNNVVELGKDFEIEDTEKEAEAENLDELMNHLKDQLKEENFQMLSEAVKEDHGDKDEEEEEKEEKEETEKSAKFKQTKSDTQPDESVGEISFQKAAEQYKQEV